MRIVDLRRSPRGGWTALEGEVRWEERPRAPQSVYFATPEAADLSPRLGDPFVTGAVLAALHHGERRVRIDEPVCPLLLDNLRTVVTYYDRWFYGGERRLEIEAPRSDVTPRAPRRVGAFFSGGIDSLFTVFHNHRTVPAGHSARIQDGVVMLGFEMRVDDTSADAKYERVLAALAPVAASLDLTLVPLATNLRELEPGGDFWGDVFQGAILAAAGHSLGARLSDAVVASSVDVAQLRPYGTHPAVDPSLSSADLRVHHRDERFTRLDKVTALVDGGVDLSHLRICSRAPLERLNCGACEKCLRVRLELIAASAQGPLPFERADVTAQEVGGLRLDASVAPFYPELVPALAAAGRSDLSHAVRTKLLEDLPRRVWDRTEDAAKDIDHALLGGRLRRWVRAWRHR